MKRRIGHELDDNWYRIVSTLTDRDAIPTDEREQMLKVGVQANGTTYVLYGGITNSNWITEGTGGGSGTVTSAGLSMPTQFAVANSPITTSGTFNVTWASATQNHVFAGPSGGAGIPAFRALVPADLIIGSGGNSSEYLNAAGNWAVPSGTGGGNVSNTGTPADNQIAVWTSATVIEGSANLTFSGELYLYRPATGGLHVEVAGTDTRIWRIGEPSNAYGYYVLYAGTGSGNANYLQYWSENLLGTDIMYSQVDQAGVVQFLISVELDSLAEHTTDAGVDITSKLLLSGLSASTQSNVLYYNSATDEISYGTTPSGGGGGTVTSVSAGNGMNFTTITATGSVVMRTPTVNLSGTTTNSVSGTGHTHAINSFAGSAAGLVPISTGGETNFLRADGEWQAPGGAGGGTVTSVTAGNGMTFTEITGSGAITMGTPGTLNLSTTNAVQPDSHTHNLDIAEFSGVDPGLVPTSTNNTTLFLRADGNWFAPSGSGTVTLIQDGNGMTFTDITSTGSVILGTPSTLTLSTTNVVTTNSHTHNLSLPTFSGGTIGFVPAAAGSTTLFLSAAGTWLAPAGSGSGTVTEVSAGAGMTFSDINTTGSVTLGTPITPLSLSTTNAVATNSHTHALSLPTFSGSSVGLVPAAIQNNTYFLNADGGWTVPAGTGAGSSGSAGKVQYADGSGGFDSYTNLYYDTGTLHIGTALAPVGTYSFMIYKNNGSLANFRTYGAMQGYINIQAPSGYDTAVYFNAGSSHKWAIGNDESASTFNIKAGSVGDFSTDNPFVLDSSGNLEVQGIMTSDNFQLSDPKLKEFKSTIGNGLELALMLNPLYHTWKDIPVNKNKSRGEQLGFSSLDAANVHSSLVSINNNGYQTVSYNKISVINNAAIHTLAYKWETHEQKIIRLEKKVRELEQKVDGS